jgi:mRNA deadenylase 3'-5' endonuclease subunit Ccr4
MISAYAAKLGKEPEYTNHAKVKTDPAFIDCLDYIFTSSADSWIADEVLALPSLAEGLEIGPLPAMSEPSDHLMLSAALTLK